MEILCPLIELEESLQSHDTVSAISDGWISFPWGLDETNSSIASSALKLVNLVKIYNDLI